ncbi:MAG TPA: EAL domain-containing protein [Burkholderiales bacterium]|nr:EAL domain-containing protein [Burkholderiales bacterium]
MDPAVSEPDDLESAPARGNSKLGLASTWASRYLTPFLTALAVLALSVVLVLTIYFTQLDLEWTAFLLGVLFAAVLSMVSQSVKAQMRLVRRTAQLRRSKELLAEEVARRERSAQAMKAADARFRTVLDALPAMVVFVDREERCRSHNLAFEQWCGRSAADIGGLALREIVDPAVYDDLKKHGEEALVGKEVEYEASWPNADGDTVVKVKLMPYPVGAPTASGFYVFVTPIACTPLRSAGAPGNVMTAGSPEAASDAAYFDAMEQQISSDESARELLLRAIEEDRFILLEQKIESLAPDAAKGGFREILLRLQEEEKDRTLAPGGFFDVAEHYDLMPAIDRWVVRKLLRSCASIKSADRAWRMPLYCLNISAATLRDRGFANHVRGQLEHWEISGNRLCFEIDHGALNDQQAEIGELMGHLKPLGCRFSVDGFGSHKVSFAPFSQLRFDYLKIDGAIIRQILNKTSELAKARAIVLACRKIGVQTIAQFVEDDATRAKLVEIGVDYVQGFGVDKPGPLAVVAPMAVVPAEGAR